MRTRLTPWVAVAALAAPLHAFGLEPPPAGAPVDGPSSHYRLSLTFAPILLLLPVGKATVEFRGADTLSGAAVLAGGIGGGNLLFQAGGQVRWYPLGDFDRGVQLGAEVLGVFAWRPVGTATVVPGVALTAGPLVGYKTTADFGLTAEFQVGATFALATTQMPDGWAWESGVAPLININVGWSF